MLVESNYTAEDQPKVGDTVSIIRGDEDYNYLDFNDLIGRTATVTEVIFDRSIILPYEHRAGGCKWVLSNKRLFKIAL